MSEFKIACPRCGQHMACDDSYAGLTINCPSCQTPLAVPASPPSSAPPPDAANSDSRAVIARSRASVLRDSAPYASAVKPEAWFPYGMAKASWKCTLIGLGVLVLASFVPKESALVRAILSLMVALLVIVAFGCAVIVLCGIPKLGARGILSHALAGLLLNGGLIAMGIASGPDHARTGWESWQSHQVAGLSIVSPSAFTKSGESDVARTQPGVFTSIEAYQTRGNMVVSLTHALLSPTVGPNPKLFDKWCDIVAGLSTKDHAGASVADMRETAIHGMRARRWSVQYTSRGKLHLVEHLTFQEGANLWVISVVGPADYAELSQKRARIFGSIRLIRQ